MRRCTQCIVPVVLNRSSSLTLKQPSQSFNCGSNSFVRQVIRRGFSGTSATLTGNSSIMEPGQEFTAKRVLSIQSHVVHGYVGNKSATFPLQVSIHFYETQKQCAYDHLDD